MTKTEYVVTPLGVVPLKLVDRGCEPLALIIHGSFAKPDALEWLKPERADTAFLNLPGFHSPDLAVTSVGVFIGAFDHLIRERFQNRPLTVLGSSAGAIVAAGLRSPEIRSRVLVEPFFSTSQLWPLQEWMIGALAAAEVSRWKWVWDIFGFGPGRLEERDYRPALRVGPPTIAIVGDVPLAPPRYLEAFPSFTSERDRALLLSVGAELRAFPGGHNVGLEAPDVIRTALNDALARQA